MPAITTVPREIVLEITRFAALKDAIALLTTCKVLHKIYETRPFWMDQILRLKQRFNPLLPYHLGSLDIEELKAIARKPYVFETAIRKQRIRPTCHSRLETRREVYYRYAKIVPGGRWLFTLSTEFAGPTEVVSHPILRVWSISPPVPDIPHCVASLDLRPSFTPLELCLQPGNSSSDLFVFVNCDDRVHGQEGRSSYLQVLHIDMADESPRFTLVAEHHNDRFCSGMGMQGQNLIVSSWNHGRGFDEALAWDWRRDEKVFVQSPNAAGVCRLMTASQELTTLWNAETRCIEVYEPSPSGGYERVGNHAPRRVPRTDGGDPRSVIFPTLANPWNSGTDLDQIALAHLEDKTLRIDMENLGSGRIRFTHYRKDNIYMQDRADPPSPFGNPHETPSDFVKTVSEHLVDLSSSGRLTFYLAPESGHEEGECISYGVYDTILDGQVLDDRYPFICPFSGVVGSVCVPGELFLWRLE